MAQFTMFILKRSPFSNSGRELMISLYSGFAFAVISAAVVVSKPSTDVSCFLNEPENSSHIPRGIPVYFMCSSCVALLANGKVCSR